MSSDPLSLRAMAEALELKLRAIGYGIGTINAHQLVATLAPVAIAVCQSSWANEKAEMAEEAREVRKIAQELDAALLKCVGEKAEMERQLAEADAVVAWLQGGAPDWDPDEEMNAAMTVVLHRCRQRRQRRHASLPLAAKGE